MHSVADDINFYNTSRNFHPVPSSHTQPPADDAPMVEWALYYAALGLKVIPVHTPLFDDDGNCVGCTCEAYKRSEKYCQWLASRGREREFNPEYKCLTPGKHPRFARWQERATSDPATIQKWWGWWPHANVGHNPGRAEFGPARRPLIMLDEDSYKDTYSGAGLALPAGTPTALTGNLGSHAYFYMPSDKSYGQHTGDMPEGIDIRGVDGLDVLPPSLHYSGRRYQWELDLSLSDLDPHALPQHVIDLIESHNGYRKTEIGPSDIEAVQRSAELVERLLAHAAIDNSGAQAWGDGRRWILHDCPFQPAADPHAADGGSFIVVYQDGTIGAGCHHNRCQHAIKAHGGTGWRYLKQLTGFQAADDVTFEDDQKIAYQQWLASPDAIDELKAADFKNPEKARKLLDTIFQVCEKRNSLRVAPGYAYLARESTISKAGIGAYLARLFDGGFIEIYPGGDGEPTRIELVLRNLNTMSVSAGHSVQVVKNWNLYREFRPDEAFINNHAVYNATHPDATLPALGDNGLGVLLTLQDGPVTIREAAAEMGYSYGAMARTLRRFAEHGLVDVEAGERNRKIYMLKAEWRDILQANRPQMPTYAVLFDRRIKELRSRIKYLRAQGEDARAGKVQAEHDRLKPILDRAKARAGIVPYQRPPRRDKHEERWRRLTHAQVVGERAEYRPKHRTETEADRWRQREYAKSVAEAHANWDEFNAWATMQHGPGWWVRMDQTDILGQYRVFTIASANVPPIRWAGEVAA